MKITTLLAVCLGILPTLTYAQQPKAKTAPKMPPPIKRPYTPPPIREPEAGPEVLPQTFVYKPTADQLTPDSDTLLIVKKRIVLQNGLNGNARVTYERIHIRGKNAYLDMKYGSDDKSDRIIAYGTTYLRYYDGKVNHKSGVLTFTDDKKKLRILFRLTPGKQPETLTDTATDEIWEKADRDFGASPSIGM